MENSLIMHVLQNKWNCPICAVLSSFLSSCVVVSTAYFLQRVMLTYGKYVKIKFIPMGVENWKNLNSDI
jgi:hypothetical protein